jgi:hypothetical protein
MGPAARRLESLTPTALTNTFTMFRLAWCTRLPRAAVDDLGRVGSLPARLLELVVRAVWLWAGRRALSLGSRAVAVRGRICIWELAGPVIR